MTLHGKKTIHPSWDVNLIDLLEEDYAFLEKNCFQFKIVIYNLKKLLIEDDEIIKLPNKKFQEFGNYFNNLENIKLVIVYGSNEKLFSLIKKIYTKKSVLLSPETFNIKEIIEIFKKI